MYNLKNRVVLVTGAGQGLGEKIARDFLIRGATVVATDSTVPEWCVEKHEDKLIRLKMDCCNESDVIFAVNEASSQTSGINVLINNTGFCADLDTLDTSLESWNNSITKNLTEMFLTTREVVKSMCLGNYGGSIINVNSIFRSVPLSNSVAYNTARAGIVGFTQSLAAQYRHLDITVNAVCPSLSTVSPLYNSVESLSRATDLSFQQISSIIEKDMPGLGLREPKDISNTVLFLASNLARDITGEALYCNNSFSHI